MRSNTVLMMLAVIAAFGLLTAALVLPNIPQVHAVGSGDHPSESVILKACGKSRNHAFGGCAI